jgi:hypothetical protein
MAKKSKFERMKEDHEKKVEALCAEQTQVFEAYLRTLIAKVNKELPEFNGVVSCNGSTWTVGDRLTVGEDDPIYIRYINPDPESDDFDDVYPLDNIRNIFDYFGGWGWQPKVSDECLEVLREIYEICQYMGDARFHTFTEPEVVLKEFSKK